MKELIPLFHPIVIKLHILKMANYGQHPLMEMENQKNFFIQEVEVDHTYGLLMAQKLHLYHIGLIDPL